MRSAQVVIGANFGDEGKGLAVDYLTSRHGGDSLVVRFNGGAQAGHTVVVPDGRRHVFGHIGSGTFNGGATFLSRFFVSNPILFLRELAQLRTLGLNPRVIVDPAGLITTPYDMMLNQHVESLRGGARHGSCGVGFGETIERNCSPGYRIEVHDLQYPKLLATRLDAIRKAYVARRLTTLGIGTIPDHLLSDEILERFIEDCERFLEAVDISDSTILRARDGIVFEGAQGLMLDMDHGYWPHVTRSKTGLANVVELATSGGLSSLELHYVTRAYLTRHGAGPLPNELDVLPSAGVLDRTNITNAWQGELRFAPHDMDVMRTFIARDLEQGKEMDIHCNMLVTCLDQMSDTINVLRGGRRCDISTSAFANELKSMIGADAVASSWGESRATVYA